MTCTRLTAQVVGSLFLSFFAIAAFSQSKPAELPHIKIVLVGTFHFDYTPDKNKTDFADLFSPKRQRELQVFTTQLARLKPDKIFVENEPDRQMRWDSLFRLYQAAKLDTTSIRNEIFQVGMRTARKAGLNQVICVDHQQELPYDQLDAFNQRLDKDSAAQKEIASYKLFNVAYPYPKRTKKLADMSVSDYYRYVNSSASLAIDRAEYFVFAPNYGYGQDYTGVGIITSWYERNAKIFTNILRKANPRDKLYIVLFGSSHMLPLRHYFQNHPFFEVVELNSVLTANKHG